MPDMPARTVFVIVKTKPEQREQARFALEAHGIATEFSDRSDCEIDAWFQPPTDTWPPAIDYVWDCYSKVTEALADTPFIAVEPGTLEDSALTSWVAFVKQTGHALGFLLDPTHATATQLQALVDLVEGRGLKLEDITWRPAREPEQFPE